MSEQMVDIYDVPCDVQPIRTFAVTQSELGVGYALSDPSTWFVYDRAAGAVANGTWHMHCGPYSTFEQGKDWILGISERNDR